jgi:NADH-quinone oxidoreductase subunit K
MILNITLTLFTISLLILLLKPNYLFVLFALELLLLAVNINFIFGSLMFDDFLGQSISLILFSVAAVDTAIGLSLLLNFYNLRK